MRSIRFIGVVCVVIVLLFGASPSFANPKPTSTDPKVTSTPAAKPTGNSIPISEGFIPKKPDGYEGPLPDCAFKGSCRNANDLLELLVNWGQKIFGLIGSVALVMFVYGGFTMVTSAGNAEKVKKGREVLVAAVIGLVIAFSSYLLIDFILDAFKVSDDFRGVK